MMMNNNDERNIYCIIIIISFPLCSMLLVVVIKSIHKSAILKWRIYCVDWLILKAYKGFKRLHFLRINKN
jgi:hypothetical protein